MTSLAWIAWFVALIAWYICPVMASVPAWVMLMPLFPLGVFSILLLIGLGAMAAKS
jgi:hypothetical protein